MSRTARASSVISDAASAQTLEERWRELFDVGPPRSSGLIEQAIAWREQVLVHGDVSLAVRHDLKLAADQARTARENGAAPLPLLSSGNSGRLNNPGAALPTASSQLLPGTRLVKVHNCVTHVVEVTATGMLYQGQVYASLSAVAKAITGTHWNGLLFFGLRKRKTYPAKAQPSG